MTAILAVAAGAYPTTTVLISLSDQDIAESGNGSVSATYSVANDGNVKNGHGTILQAWLLGMGGLVADYEVMATRTSGPTPTGSALSSWLSCSTSRTWSILNSASNNSTITSVLTIQIRRASDQVVLASATITLSAESDNFN